MSGSWTPEWQRRARPRRKPSAVLAKRARARHHCRQQNAYIVHLLGLGARIVGRLARALGDVDGAVLDGRHWGLGNFVLTHDCLLAAAVRDAVEQNRRARRSQANLVMLTGAEAMA